MSELRTKYQEYFVLPWWDLFVDNHYCSSGLLLVCHGMEGIDTPHTCNIEELLDKEISKHEH